MRKLVAKAESLADLRLASLTLQERYEPYVNGSKEWVAPEPVNPDLHKLSHPHYLCQPYVRPPKKSHLTDEAIIVRHLSSSSQDLDEETVQAEKRRKLNIPEVLQSKLNPQVQYSINKLKKMARKPLKNWEAERIRPVLCTTKSCTNPQGQKCDFNLCRPCCKSKCYVEELDCPGHKILIKTARTKARERDAVASSTSSINDKNVVVVEQGVAS